ncbi:MAG: ribonuclease P protein component [Rhodocyclaceae bacterium]|jgi:ribonuclease P protein component|nr:ribonuclease P protein component [Rhodocyclaceae bacterium]
MVSLSACVRAAVVRSSALVAPKDGHVSASEVTAAGVGLGFRDEHRLRKTDEFSSVFAFRRSLRGRHFDLLYRPGSAATARIGMIVAKKHVRSAVNRNLVRRIVRESFRLIRAHLPKMDIVVRVSTRLERPDRRILRGEIDELLARLTQ